MEVRERMTMWWAILIANLWVLASILYKDEDEDKRWEYVWKFTMVAIGFAWLLYSIFLPE